METLATLGRHMVGRGVAAAAGAVRELADDSLLGLDARATGAALCDLVALEAQVAELKLRVLAHGAEVHVQETTGATTAATWLASATRTTVRAARRAAVLAEALGDYEVLRAAMATGGVLVEQAEAITRALDALPADVPSWVRVEAEQTLVDAAGEHDATALRVLGDRILHLVAPECPRHSAQNDTTGVLATHLVSRTHSSPEHPGCATPHCASDPRRPRPLPRKACGTCAWGRSTSPPSGHALQPSALESELPSGTLVRLCRGSELRSRVRP